MESRGDVAPAAATTIDANRKEGILDTERIWMDNYNNCFKTNLLAESISWRGNRNGSDDESSDGGPLDPGVPKGCQFSPDGTCLLTARANKLELYNTPFEFAGDEEGDGDEANHEIHQNSSGGDRDDEATNTTTTTGGAWEPAITCNSGESVRSYAWYPHMKSSDPASCCFLGVSRDSPVHLYDAYDGSIRATYRPYNRLDEMESPTTVCFVENGQKLVTGGLRTDRLLHVFDINRPGRDHAPPMLKLGKTRRSKDGQKGLVSAMAYSEGKGVIAVGTYSPGSIYLYDLRTYTKSAVAEIVLSSAASTSSGGTVCVAGHGKRARKNKRKSFVAFEDDASPAGSRQESIAKDGKTCPLSTQEQPPPMNFSAAKLQWYQSRTRGGVTQVEFENNNNNDGTTSAGGGHYLFSTSRRSNAILQWDLRKLSSSNFCPGIASFETNNDTNQRIEFQVKGSQLWTGGIDGCVRVYSHKRPTATKDSLLAKIPDFGDCVNGISLHPDACLDLQRSKAGLEKFVSADPNNDDKDGTNDRVGCSSSSSGFDNNEPIKSLIAITLGQRQFPLENDLEDDDPHEALTNRTKHFVGSTQIYSFEERTTRVLARQCRRSCPSS